MNPLNHDGKYIILHFEDWNSTEGPTIYTLFDKDAAKNKWLDLTSNQKEKTEEIILCTVNRISYLKRIEEEPERF